MAKALWMACAVAGFGLAQTLATPAPAENDYQELLGVKRICVEKFAGDEALVATVREMAIAGLFALKRFRVSEKCDKADATLKGAVLERGERRIRGEGEATDFGAAAGGASVSRNSGSAGFGAVVGGSGEALFSAETASRASVTLRLVNSDGDVIWAYTQDSAGGKTKGAVVDAVEKGIRQLYMRA